MRLPSCRESLPLVFSGMLLMGTLSHSTLAQAVPPGRKVIDSMDNATGWNAKDGAVCIEGNQPEG